MGLIVENFQWILIVTGALTSLMMVQVFAPARGLSQMFGSSTDDANALMIVRHWYFLVGVVGLLLLYAAYNPEVRTIVLWIAIASKSAFAALILARFRELSGTPAVIAALADVIMVALYLIYLVAA